MNNAYTAQQAIDAAPTRQGLSFGQLLLSSGSDSPQADGSLTVSYGNNHKTFVVALKTHLHHAMIDRIIADRLKNDQPLMLITDQIGNKHADMLIKAGVAFLDTAGNAYLDLPGINLSVTGRKAATPLSKPSPGRAFQASGLKLLYAFLTDLQACDNPADALINKPFRTINQQTDISVGSIGWVLNDLKDAGFIVIDGKTRLLLDRNNLLQKWVSNYIDRLRPKQVLNRFTSNRPDWWQTVTLNAPDQLWSGEIAAAKLTGFLKPQIATIYTSSTIDDLILDAGLRSDPNGDIILMRSFWKRPIAHNDCTHPLLIYADLLASDIDRNIETAQRIYDDYLHKFIDAD